MNEYSLRPLEGMLPQAGLYINLLLFRFKLQIGTTVPYGTHQLKTFAPSSLCAILPKDFINAVQCMGDIGMDGHLVSGKCAFPSPGAAACV